MTSEIERDYKVRIEILETQIQKWMGEAIDASNEAQDLREQLEIAAEFLHALTPAGIPAVDAFIKKWRK